MMRSTFAVLRCLQRPCNKFEFMLLYLAPVDGQTLIVDSEDSSELHVSTFLWSGSFVGQGLHLSRHLVQGEILHYFFPLLFRVGKLREIPSGTGCGSTPIWRKPCPAAYIRLLLVFSLRSQILEP